VDEYATRRVVRGGKRAPALVFAPRLNCHTDPILRHHPDRGLWATSRTLAQAGVAVSPESARKEVVEHGDEPIDYEIPVQRRDGSETTVRSVHPDAVAYNLLRVLPDQAVKDFGLLVSPRRYSVGDIVNLPESPDDGPKGGKGYVWRVAAVDDHPPTLRVEFLRPHGDVGV
jgi:hypothetical protein